jgi:hypothetical protein
MKRKMLALFVVAVFALTGAPLFAHMDACANMTAYYVSQSSGNDSYAGLTPSTAWKTLTKAGSKAYGPGDSLLLKCGDEWNEQLTITNSSGTAANPIVISSFGTGAKPKIRRNSGQDEQCLRIEIPSGFKITNLDIGYAGQGIFLWFANATGKDYIWIENCQFHDIDGVDYWTWFNEAKNTEKYRTTYSNGISVVGFWDGVTVPVISNITIKHCTALNSKSLFMVGCTRTQDNAGGLERGRVIRNFVAEDDTSQGGTFGWWVERVDSGHVSNVIVRNAGKVYYSYGTTGGGIQSLSNFTIRDCEFGWTRRSGGPDGCGFDFEGDCDHVRFVHNYVHDNAGVGLMFFDGAGANASNVIDSCIFRNNCVDPSAPTGYELYYSSPTTNNGGSVTNNSYYSHSGIQFIDGTANNTVKNNTVYDPEPENLAFAAPVAASVNLEDAGWGLAKLTDGIPMSIPGSKGWTSDPGFGSPNNAVWVEVDLGANHQFNKVILYPRTDTVSTAGGSPNFPVDYTIQVKANGAVSYTTVKTVTNQANPNDSAQTFTFVTTSARYVRIAATKLGTPALGEPTAYRMQLSEFEVYYVAPITVAPAASAGSHAGFATLRQTRCGLALHLPDASRYTLQLFDLSGRMLYNHAVGGAKDVRIPLQNIGHSVVTARLTKGSTVIQTHFVALN